MSQTVRVRTAYVPATDTTGSRVRVVETLTRRQRSYPFPYDARDAHEACVRAYAREVLGIAVPVVTEDQAARPVRRGYRYLVTEHAPYFATKYDSAAAEVIAILSSVSEGYGKDETGDAEAPTGYFALVLLDDSCDLDFSDYTNYPLGDEAGELAREYGVTADDVKGSHIVTTNSQGFVSVETFDSAQQARDEYDCRACRYGVWSDEDRAEDDDVYICSVTGHGYHTL